MAFKNIYLKCDCACGEIIEFRKFHSDDYEDYEISILDSFCSHEFTGVKSRLKRAWKAFCAKPVYYTGVVCTEKDKMKKFLTDCLELLEENSSNT